MLACLLLVGAATSEALMPLSPPCYSREECLLAAEQKRVVEEVEASALVPCGCEGTPRLFDLGREYFPRFLSAVDCSGSCWREPYRCRQRYYEVKVLKRKDKADEVSGRQDLSLPDSLRDLWKFVAVKVVVACECSL